MESTLTISLPVIWLCIIGFFLLYYAVTDGFALGIGMISLRAKDEEERSLLMASIESTWHDHQTWLVLLGGMLFGAFPVFYGLVLSSLYIPILAMLFGLVFRGVSFEFRALSPRKRFWGFAFSFGSVVVTLAQGFGLGGLLSGLPVQDGQFIGSVWGWLNPFAALVALGVVFGYVMLGANFLIWRTEGELQGKSRRVSLISSVGTLLIAGAVHLWTTVKYPHMIERWKAPGLLPPEAAFIGLAVIAFAFIFRSLIKGREFAPLVWNAALILFSFAGLSLGLYPYMIPNVVSPVTVEAAAASPPTLLFMLVATTVLLPVILTYTAYKYRVFHGKVRLEGYGGEEEVSSESLFRAED